MIVSRGNMDKNELVNIQQLKMGGWREEEERCLHAINTLWNPLWPAVWSQVS